MAKTYRYLTYGFLHYFFSSVGQTFFISLFVASMSARMGWGDGTFATLYSSVTLVAAFTLPAIGKQIDKFRVRYVSTAAALLLVAGTLVLSFTHWLPLLVLGLFVVRLGGQGVLPLIGSTTIGRYFSERRGRALSSSIVGISVAEITLPPLATYAMLGLGYEKVWLMMAGALVMVFLPAIWFLVGRHDDFQRADTVAEAQKRANPEAEEENSWTRGQVLRDRRFQLILPIVLFVPFVFTGLAFNQSVIGEIRDYSPELMAFGLSAYGVAKVIFLLTGGQITDRVGPDRMLRFVLGPAILGVLVLALVEAEWSVPVFFALFGISSGLTSVLVPALWAQRYGPRFLGSIKSTVWLFIVLASAAAPVVFSYGLQWGIRQCLMGIIGYGVLCLFLAWWERKQ